jgi:hypothetical protein
LSSKNKVIIAIFDRQTKFKGLFYDISAWSFLTAFNVNFEGGQIQLQLEQNTNQL